MLRFTFNTFVDLTVTVLMLLWHAVRALRRFMLRALVPR
jgi:hypothetical protein